MITVISLRAPFARSRSHATYAAVNGRAGNFPFRREEEEEERQKRRRRTARKSKMWKERSGKENRRSGDETMTTDSVATAIVATERATVIHANGTANEM